MLAVAEIEIDEELAGLIPPLTDEERQQLEANILADGCRDPLAVWAEEGFILDGHNRYHICQQHDVPFDVREVSLPDRDAAKVWVIRNQFARRNLTPFQRAELALRLKEIIERTAMGIVRLQQSEFTAERSDKEDWKPIEGFPRFSVSNYGRVARDPKTTVGRDGVTYSYSAGLVRQTKTAMGYLSVSLRHGEKRASLLVHKLVAEAFVANPESKPAVHHLNGNRQDNYWRNLAWATAEENNRHQKAQYKRPKWRPSDERCTLARTPSPRPR